MEYKKIYVSITTHEYLLRRKHPGQSFGGVIDELIKEFEGLKPHSEIPSQKPDTPCQTKELPVEILPEPTTTALQVVKDARI